MFFAASVAVGAFAVAALLLAVLALQRFVRHWSERRLARRAESWLAALSRATEDPNAARLPPIGRLELPEFLALWNKVREAHAGRAAENLETLLREQGLETRVLRLTRSAALRPRLVAITAAGLLRDERAWPCLEAFARSSGPVTSFAAARALLRIEPRRALEVLSPHFSARHDWSLARLGSLFEELGPAVVTAPLVAILLARPRKGLNRIVKLARFGHRERIATLVSGWLGSSDDPEVIIAALEYVDNRADLRWAREAAAHGEWRVRMAAARALGRIGQREELPVLLDLLRDTVWWVRYHAAQALARLDGLEPRELETMRENARDAFAADMLGQALAEMGRR